MVDDLTKSRKRNPKPTVRKAKKPTLSHTPICHSNILEIVASDSDASGSLSKGRVKRRKVI